MTKHPIHIEINKAKLQLLPVTAHMCHTLCEWEQVAHLLERTSKGFPGSFIAARITEVCFKLRAQVQVRDTSDSTSAHYTIGAFDSDAIGQLVVMMSFTFELGDWVNLMNALKKMAVPDALAPFINEMSLLVARLEHKFTIAVEETPA
jgi:hypothetical protein